MAYNKILHDTIISAVDNQLKANNPPETKKTLQRLIGLGYSEQDSKKLIAQCISVEIFRAMKFDESHDEERYKRNLNNLPSPPFDDDEDD
jgi:hypothetical protein